MMKFSALILMSFSMLVAAQEGVKYKHLRFIPLGDEPPFRRKIEKDKAIVLPPRPGEVPPKPALVALDPKEGNDVSFRLNQFTKWSSIKHTAGGVKLFEGKAIAGKPWVASRFGSKSQSLGILYPDHAKKNWFAPKMKVVPDDPGSFPVESIRFVNVSHRTAVVRFGKAKADLIKPGKILIKKLKRGKNPVLVGYLDPAKKNEPDVVFQNDLTLRPKQRIQAFFYQAQGKNPPKAVKFVHHGEFYAPPPKPKKAAAVAGG